jgi:hypothetical protein
MTQTQYQTQAVEHHLFDQLFENHDDEPQSSSAMSQCIPFPWKLHEMLDTAEKEGREFIVSWLPQGNGFRVHSSESFVSRVMPRYFKQTKYKSFQRQLNIWGFQRIIQGSDKGGYTHLNFLRGKPSLCRHMRRQKIKGSAPKPSYTAPVSPLPSICKHLSSTASCEPQNVASSSPHSIAVPKTMAPDDGDCVLFAGRNFYFVSDYEQTASTLLARVLLRREEV